MGFCPASCAGDDLIRYTTQDCVTKRREKTFARAGFMLCSTDLPDPMDEAAFKALVDSGEIVWSNEVANFAPGDPTTEDVAISDCRTALRIIRGRELVFEDRIAIEVNEGSPAILNKFKDYEWWDDKVMHTFQLRVLLAYCDGDVVAAKDRNGGWLSADVSAYLNWQRSNTQGASSLEFKRISILFNGDPFALYNKPFINLIEAGIEI